MLWVSHGSSTQLTHGFLPIVLSKVPDLNSLATGAKIEHNNSAQVQIILLSTENLCSVTTSILLNEQCYFEQNYKHVKMSLCLSMAPWVRTNNNYSRFYPQLPRVPKKQKRHQEWGPIPGWCGSVDWALACRLKGCWLDSRSGHMPGL